MLSGAGPVRLAACIAIATGLHATLPQASAHAQYAVDPEGATGLDTKALVRAKRHMVVSANPYATNAGLQILRSGGTAVDAAIAVQMVLGLVEPQSSGIGGGAFLLAYDRKKGRLLAYDGRETAPAGIKPDVFMNPDGSRRPFWDAVATGESVGVPGAVAMLALAHKRHGRLPWNRLMQPAIRLALDGFLVSPRLSKLLTARGPARFSPAARDYFFGPDSKPHQPGTRLKNPDYARTLQELAANGADAFYRGRIARAIVEAVRAAPSRPGTMTLADIASYRPIRRNPVCTTYRTRRVCGMGPPSSGGHAVAMTLELIEPFDLGRAPLNANGVHLVVEAEKLAYADRNRWIADPETIKIPHGLLSPAYLADRRKLISPSRAQPKAAPGLPPGAHPRKAGRDATQERAGTSHVSIVDSRGNAVALTTSIESGFGSGLMAAGFLLNNQLTDFSFRPVDDKGYQIANAVAPGKRPRSSMAPTILFDAKGRLAAVLGSPGGSRIPLYVIKSVVGLIDWRLDAQAAADLPNFGSRNGPLELEMDYRDERLPEKLAKLGHSVKIGPMTSGTHIIVRRPGGRLEGGADPRREGVARGD